MQGFLQYIFFGQGVFSFPPAEALAFTHSKLLSSPAEQGNDIQFHFMPFKSPFVSFWPGKAKKEDEGVMLWPTLLLPRSRGTLRLASSDPQTPPLLDPMYLTDERDLEVGIAAFKKAREVVSSQPLKDLIGHEVLDPEIPFPSRSEEYMVEYIKKHCATVYHPCGTARIGPPGDKEAVLDLKMRVRGIQGLRVADASIMPSIVTGNTNAAVVMIGERAADFILEESH